MHQESDNFVPAIHERDYEQRYREPRFDCSTMVADCGRTVESLGGSWTFGVDQYDTCLRARWWEERTNDDAGRPLPVDFSFDQWESIDVPSCWNLEQERLALYEGTIVYTRRFDYLVRGDGRTVLKFGAVNYEAKVFLNQRYLGRHEGGSTPFYVEITDLVQEKNRLVVVANNRRRSDAVPCENTDWFNYGGIHRDVALLRLPKAFIRRFAIALVPGSGFGRLRIDLEVDGAPEGTARVELPELNLSVDLPIVAGKGSRIVDARPLLWSPERPKRYEVRAQFRDDTVSDRVGFREIGVEGTSILLNGAPLLLKGISLHEESVENGRTLSDGEIVENITLAKELGCNFMRLAHYPHSQRVAELCDELGMLVWEEIPVYWALDFDNPETYRNAENQLLELLTRDANRVSVILWSVGNENADSDSRYRFMSALARRAKEFDPSRLVTAACLVDHTALRIADRLAADLDVVGINEYYGWYDRDLSKLGRIFENSRIGKPLVISEFGADARSGRHGTADDLGSEECQLEIYRAQLATLRTVPDLRGMSPWILYDFRCPRRLHETQDYYNIKGLLTADKRQRKLAFAELQAFYRTWQL